MVLERQGPYKALLKEPAVYGGRGVCFGGVYYLSNDIFSGIFTSLVFCNAMIAQTSQFQVIQYAKFNFE